MNFRICPKLKKEISGKMKVGNRKPEDSGEVNRCQSFYEIMFVNSGLNAYGYLFVTQKEAIVK